MIHVLNFEGNIIDFISNNDNAIIHAKHNRDINERTETYDLTILSDRATHFLKKNRVIVQDSNKRYREFIIDHIESSEDGYTEIEMSASYLTDIGTAKPLAPNKLDKMTTSQALDDVLKDTGWQRSDETEYGGIRTTSWTSYQTKYEVLLQLCTTYDMSLDFYIELGSNKVKGRYVSLKEKNPLFKGKEIVKGKDLLSLKRTVDLNEVRTALLCVGPEKDDGTRLELIVTDDEAQEQFGLPQRYLWGIYEPESEDSSMTETRLRSLGTTELNKRKVATISYEVSAIVIKKENPHEIVNLGDLVRIKDRDFNPPLYIEAEVIGEEYDPISEDSTYTFGQFKEYNESDLRAEFNKKLSSIQKKLVDSINNVNTIIRDTLDDELQYYEQKIIKSDTPPENPVNDMLWYDTSNPNVAVLWRYFNGEWREHSVNDVEQIGGVTHEKALFSELNNTFINLSIQHAKMLKEVYEVTNSEYLIDIDLKNDVNTKLNDTIGIYNQIKTNLDSMTPETATIGKLIDTQTLYLTYRERIQALYTTLETAKIAIDDRFKLLQAQYTEEKFNEAMQGVATAIGGTYNEETGQLIADIPNNDMLEDLRVTIEQSLSDLTQANQVKLQELQDGITETNQRITSTSEELSAGITSITQKIDGLKVGGRNLLLDSRNRTIFKPNNTGLGIPIKNADNSWTITPDIDKSVSVYHFIQYTNKNDVTSKPLALNEWYTISFEVMTDKDTTIEIGINSSGIARPNDKIERYEYYEVKANTKSKIHFTFKWINEEILFNIPIIIRITGNNNIGTILTYDYPKLEEGTIATDWTPAIEDTQALIQAKATEIAKAEALLSETNAKAYADGIVSDEEQARISQSSANLNLLRQESLTLENRVKAYADGIVTAEEQARMTADDAKLAESQRELELAEIRVKAYADGIVDDEEVRAIADAQAKLTQAKTYADQKAADAKTYTDGKISNITTTVTTQAADIKILKDGIALKANNTEVTKIYDQYLTPLQTQVNAQKATLDVLPSQIAAKVSQAKYDADMNSVVGRLNTSDTERIQLANEINDRVTLTEYQNMKVGTRNLLLNSKLRSDFSNSVNYSNIKYQIVEPLIVGETYTFSCDITVSGERIDNQISIRGYTPDNGLINVDVVQGKVNVTFIANTKSTELIVYKYIAGSPVDYTNVVVYNAMLVEGNKIGDYEEAPEDRDKKLTTMQTQIIQNGTDINARATKQEFNTNKKTLSRVIADLTINTIDGLTLSYDENGAITSHTVGPNGIKLKGDKVDIQANSEFNVLVGDVNNKVGKNEIINRLNVSPEGLDINVNNVGIRGGDATNYISIRNNEMLSYGVFERSWAGEQDTAKLALGIKDGRIMVRNQTTGYRLYLTERGLSTMMDGFSDDTSGTLEFHSQRFNETSRGITMHSTYGAVALLSEQSRIYTRSNLTNNIESFSYGVYIRPYMNTRAGVNEFNFYVKDADSASGTDGALLFGEISDAAGLAGSGIRFKKNAARGYDDMQSVVYATDNTGAINTGDFHAKNLLGNWKSKGGYLYAMTPERTRFTNMDGYNNGNVTYTDIQCQHILSNTIRTNTGNDFYIGVSSAELRVTNNLFWNGGDTGYKPIRASDYLPGSLERFKRDIELWQGDALGEIRDNMTTYSYHLNDDDDERKKRKGLIIGDDYKTPDDFIDGDGVSLYNMITYSLRAIQQLDEQNKQLENKIKTLEEKYHE